jgi:hypothetical protein
VPVSTGTSGNFFCRACCSPVETTVGNTTQIQGAAPHTCPARGATAAAEECRFAAFLAPNPSQATPGVGVCVIPADYSYDHDMDPQTGEVAWRSCSTLTSADTDTDGIPDHIYWGCAPQPTP